MGIAADKTVGYSVNYRKHNSYHIDCTYETKVCIVYKHIIHTWRNLNLGYSYNKEVSL